MTAAKCVFERREIKYRLSPEQYAVVLPEICRRLSADEYGETTVQSLYFDTATRLLIRNSVEHPYYKEKLRARSYGLSAPEKEIFLELKKKCDKTVFKRRICLKEKDLLPFVRSGIGGDHGQIGKEILYFCRFYGGVEPSMLLLYDRTAYYDALSGTDLRVTFDRNVRYRTERLDLRSGTDGNPLLPDGEILMEIKTGGAYPLWLVGLLSRHRVYAASFSKYGSAYEAEQKKRFTREEELPAKEKAV